MFEAIKQKTLSLNTIVSLAVGLVVILSVYGVWQFLWPTIKMNLNKPDPAVLSGRLVFSGIKAEGGKVPNTYSLKLGGQEITVENESEKYGFFSTSDIESSGNETVDEFFVRAVATDESSGTSTLVKRVLHVVLPDKLEVVSQDSFAQYGAMSWSPHKKLLARSVLVNEDAINQEKISTLNWKVVITDEKGVLKEEIADAANPVWMPNSDVLLYLRSDGIYAYDVKVGSEVRIITFLEGENTDPYSTIAIMFEVSPDGKRLVVTTPGKGNISVYEVSSTMDVKELYNQQNDSVTYSWPIVSPDGKAFAVLTRDVTDQGTANPRIEFYTVDDPSFDLINSQSLGEYLSDRVYLDDWVK